MIVSIIIFAAVAHNIFSVIVCAISHSVRRSIQHSVMPTHLCLDLEMYTVSVDGELCGDYEHNGQVALTQSVYLF